MYYNNVYNSDDSDNNYDTDGNSIIIDDNENNSTNENSLITSESSIYELDDFNFDILSINGNFEYDDDDPENIVTEHISALEDEYLYREKSNNCYLIGMAFLVCKSLYNQQIIMEKKQYILASYISPTSFYKFNYDNVKKYLFMSSIYYLRKPEINILQLHIKDDGLYTCIIKTFWLKIVQRKWKKIYALRMYIRKLRASIAEIRWREIHGTYSNKCRTMPGLIGMLFH